MQDSIELKNVIEYHKGKAVVIMSLQDNLKLLRMKSGYNQAKDFAKFAGIPYSSYSAYERGSWPNEENLIKLARALNVSIDTLIGYTPEKVDKVAKAVSLLKKVGYEVKEVNNDLYIVYDSEEPLFFPFSYHGLDKRVGYFAYKPVLIEIADSIELSPEVKEGYHKAFKSALRKIQLQLIEDMGKHDPKIKSSLEQFQKDFKNLLKKYEEGEAAERTSTDKTSE